MSLHTTEHSALYTAVRPFVLNKRISIIDFGATFDLTVPLSGMSSSLSLETTHFCPQWSHSNMSSFQKPFPIAICQNESVLSPPCSIYVTIVILTTAYLIWWFWITIWLLPLRSRILTSFLSHHLAHHRSLIKDYYYCELVSVRFAIKLSVSYIMSSRPNLSTFIAYSLFYPNIFGIFLQCTAWI